MKEKAKQDLQLLINIIVPLKGLSIVESIKVNELLSSISNYIKGSTETEKPNAEQTT